MYLQQDCSEVRPVSTAAELDQAQAGDQGPKKSELPHGWPLRHRHGHPTGNASNPSEQEE